MARRIARLRTRLLTSNLTQLPIMRVPFHFVRRPLSASVVMISALLLAGLVLPGRAADPVPGSAPTPSTAFTQTRRGAFR
jgi:hypothetical protein